VKKMLVLSVVLNAALIAALCRTESPANAETGLATSCPVIENGNVNGDQTLDLSDAVAILGNLFLGAPPPSPQFVADSNCVTALEEELATCKADLAALQAERDACVNDLSTCGAARDAALADLATCQADRSTCAAALETCQADLARCVQPPVTGQTLCYDDVGGIIDCASSTYPGQDGFYRTGCPSVGRFVDNLDGTVTDTCTGLMWQKSTAPGAFLWQAALGYCEGLGLAGHNDWRLPNLRELRTLFDYGGQVPAIDPVFEALAEMYWTSTTFNADPTHAFTVGFQIDEGNTHEAKIDPFPVRAVRGGP